MSKYCGNWSAIMEIDLYGSYIHREFIRCNVTVSAPGKIYRSSAPNGAHIVSWGYRQLVKGFWMADEAGNGVGVPAILTGAREVSPVRGLHMDAVHNAGVYPPPG